MGREKARLPLGNKNFLERITEAARELKAPVETIWEDVVPGLGPLGGVLTAFRRFRFQRAIFLSCDMPLVTGAFLERLIELNRKTRAGVFTQTRSPGFPFLLRRTDEAKVEEAAAGEDHSLKSLVRSVDARILAGEDELELRNVNTPAEYRALVRSWEEQRRSTAILEVRNLNVRRGNTQLIEQLSWKVEPGEHWVILGPNGCGKTSLFSALLGYLSATRGDIFVLGQEYGAADWPALRTKIGIVSSSVRQMMPENEPAWITIASGKYAMIDFWGTPKPGDRRQAGRILRSVEAGYLADRPWGCLSQGERQRVLIGRALMAQPALLILDEPCAGLDPCAREHFLQFLERLGRSRNAPAIVLVTHHVEEIMPLFTHVMLMKNGRKLADGPLEETLTSKQLTEAFGVTLQLRKAGGRFALRVKGNPAVII